MQILAISGSLRAASTNTTLLKAAAALAPAELRTNLRRSAPQSSELGAHPRIRYQFKLNCWLSSSEGSR